jgi:hemoglobin-like flavoprotein
MTPENQTLVRDPFATIVPIAPRAVAMSYDRLFVLDPALKDLFKGDMQDLGLGEASTPDVEAAWTETYRILATVMKDQAAA